jgi:DNA-binding NarL/FixJ family response regulator
VPIERQLTSTTGPDFRRHGRYQDSIGRSETLCELFACSERAGVAALIRALCHLISYPASFGGYAKLLESAIHAARERDVIALIARGYSNRAIADALVISEKTAEGHVSSILSKLGYNSRAQAAAYAVQQGLLSDSAR